MQIFLSSPTEQKIFFKNLFQETSLTGPLKKNKIFIICLNDALINS